MFLHSQQFDLNIQQVREQIVSQISKLNSARQWLTWSKSIDKAGPLYDLFRWWFCTKKIRIDHCIVMNFPLQAYLSFLCLNMLT